MYHHKYFNQTMLLNLKIFNHCLPQSLMSIQTRSWNKFLLHCHLLKVTKNERLTYLLMNTFLLPRHLLKMTKNERSTYLLMNTFQLSRHLLKVTKRSKLTSCLGEKDTHQEYLLMILWVYLLIMSDN